MERKIEAYRWQRQRDDGTWVDIDTLEHNKEAWFIPGTPDSDIDSYFSEFALLIFENPLNSSKAGKYRCIASTGDAITLGEPVEAILYEGDVIFESVNNSV